MDIAATSARIAARLKQSRSVVLATHRQPDSDALGSIVAFSHWLTSLGITHQCFCVDAPSDSLQWLTWFDPLTSDPDIIVNGEYDTLVVLDCSDLRHPGLEPLLAQRATKPFIIDIDHHATNRGYGDINAVVTTATSTTEILYYLFESQGFAPTGRTASALLSGIIGDSYNFTNPNTTQSSLHVASRLVSAGASLPNVSDAILKNKSIKTLQAWGSILSNMQYNQELGVAIAVITAEDFTDYPMAASEISEGIANFLNNITGIKAALIIQQQTPTTIKGSLRTNDDLIDVSQLATMLGGGGHKKAAGFQLQGKLVKTENGSWRVE